MSTPDPVMHLDAAEAALNGGAHLLARAGGDGAALAALAVAARQLLVLGDEALDGAVPGASAHAHGLVEAARALLEAPDASLPDRARLKDDLRRLSALLRALDRIHGRGHAGRLVRRTLAGAVVLAVALALGTLATAQDEGWRGLYFRGRDFVGEPVVRRDTELAFRWARRAPMPDFPDDEFSVRWTTCLVLDEDTKLTFALGSDDGSRLLLGDELVLDNWNVQAFHWERDTRTLPAGTHPVTVEYFEAGADAGVSLELTRPDAGNAPVPAAWLEVPGEHGC